MLFLQYPPCSTCQKAKRWLDDHGIAYEARHIKEENPTCFQSEPSSGSDPSRVSPKNNSSFFHNNREHLNTRQPQPDNLPASSEKAKPFHSNNLKESGNKEIITATPHPPVQEQSKPVRHSPQRKGSAPAHNRTSQEAKDNGIDLLHRETPKEIDTSGQQPSSTKGSEKPLKKVLPLNFLFRITAKARDTVIVIKIVRTIQIRLFTIAVRKVLSSVSRLTLTF